MTRVRSRYGWRWCATRTVTLKTLTLNPNSMMQADSSATLSEPMVSSTQGLTHPLPPLPFPLVCLNISSCGQRLTYGLEIRDLGRPVFGPFSVPGSREGPFSVPGSREDPFSVPGSREARLWPTNSRGSGEDRFVPGDPEKTPGTTGGSRDDLPPLTKARHLFDCGRLVRCFIGSLEVFFLVKSSSAH